VAFYSKKKKRCWVWIAFDRNRGCPIAFECGSREDATGQKLWNKVADIKCSWYATDHWLSYETFLNPWRHLKGKRFTHVIESFNATVRHYLARFHRKTHCYSKSKEMLELSLLLFFFKKYIKSIP